MTTQQGDITRIEDVNGNVLATYEYDAWGKLISSSGSLADINPLRYRGYYFDTETELYYLSNRYYDPKVSRFINADSTDAVLSANGLYDQNLFAYCDNNPVMRADNEGGFWHILVGAAVGGLISGAVQVATNLATGNKWSDGLLSSVATGAIGGAVSSSSLCRAAVFGINALASATSEGIDQVASGQKINIGAVLSEGVIGGVFGAIGGKGNGTKSLFNLGVSTVKRTTNATVHKGIKSGVKEATKAFAYYAKSTKSYYRNTYSIGSLLRDSVTEVSSNVTSNIVSSWISPNRSKRGTGSGGGRFRGSVSLL